MKESKESFPDRFDLDPFRGIVCLWLTGLHFCMASTLHGTLLRLAGDSASWWLFHVRLGAESFAVLAGFMMAHMLAPRPGESVGLSAYLKRRFYRLILPFWASILIAYIDMLVASSLVPTQRPRPPLIDVLANLSLLNEYFGIGEIAVGYWSLATLEQFYLLSVAAMVLTASARGGNRTDSLAFPGPFFRLCLIALSLLSFAGVFPTEFSLPRYAGFILTGIVVQRASALRKMTAEAWAVAAMLVACGILASSSRPFAALFSGIVVGLLARGYTFPEGRATRWLASLGAFAFSVYLIHPIVGFRVLSLTKRLPLEDDRLALLWLALAFVASIAAAYLFHVAVERPCRELSRKVAYRRRAADEADFPETHRPKESNETDSSNPLTPYRGTVG